MSENLRNNIIRSSKISDLSSKIREAENDLIFSKGLKRRESEFDISIKHHNKSTKKIAETDELPELQLLRIKQIETAQRLKETLRRNVDLMTELQKARGIVRSLEKKVNFLENSLDSKEISQFVCQQCSKQEEEVNKLKLHILQLNESFQKRWDDTQKELFQARQSLIKVSSKLLESATNGTYQGDNNSFTINNNPPVIETENRNNYTQIQNNGISIHKHNCYNSTNSVTQSPITNITSRPNSKNSHDTNLNSNILYNFRTPNIDDSNSFIPPNYFKKSNDLEIGTKNRLIRPQSENSFKNSKLNVKSLLSNDLHPITTYNSQRSFTNCTFQEQIPSIKSIEPLMLRAEQNGLNGLPERFQNENNNEPPIVNQEGYTISLENIYPHSYPTSVLQSYNKNNTQSRNYLPASTNINPYSNPNSSQTLMDNKTYLNNQFVDMGSRNFESSGDFKNSYIFNSSSVNDCENAHLNDSSPGYSLVPQTNKQPQLLQTALDDSRAEYPPSPNLNEIQCELDMENSTYGNIRRTLEELKKTQDQRVQQLKDDREKLLRAVLSDLQEMKDFQSSINNSYTEETLKGNEQKGFFSLELK